MFAFVACQKQNNLSVTAITVFLIKTRVEYVFGFMENIMSSMYSRKVGQKRAETVIGLMNLTYNMFRKIQLGAIS